MLQIIKQKRHFGAMETETIQKNAASLKSHTIRRNFLLFICIPFFFASCSTAKIYTKPDAVSYTMKHKTLAILPPKVHIEVKKKDKVENIQEQEMTESVNAQNEMYSRLLNFVQKRKIYLDIQPIEKTNAKFIETGYPYDMPPEELTKVLGVDAVLYTDCVFSKQSNVVGGIILAIALFPIGTTPGIMMCIPEKTADINMKLYDSSTGYLLYSYNNKFAERNVKYVFLIDEATKKMVKKSPFYRK
ncbi:MAG: hypothetical protein LBN27_05195 [Prevotellaceae bacterium]|jgi:hypothetical protein|nr:hypothetical protein [Prevotellaceae bacterium]